MQLNSYILRAPDRDVPQLTGPRLAEIWVFIRLRSGSEFAKPLPRSSDRIPQLGQSHEQWANRLWTVKNATARNFGEPSKHRF